MYNQGGMCFKKDLVDKYKIDLSTVKSLDDLTPIFQTIKDNEPDVYPLAVTNAPGTFVKYVPTFDEMLGVDTTTWKVYDRRSTDYVANFKAIRTWQQKGFFPSDAATLKDEDALNKAGKVFSRYQRIVPGEEATIKASWGFDVVVLPMSEAVIEQGSVRSTMDAISITSKNPDRAFMLLNLMFTNKDIFNTMVFGIAGQDYTKISDTRIEPIADKYSAPAWQLGNQFNAYLLPGQPDDVWEQTKKNNASAKYGEMGDFVFDSKNVESELANVDAVNQEFDTMLNYGLDDTDTVLAKRAEKLKSAGFDKVVAEMQTQVDAWVKANVK
jgi:putative aldouronate transport system substrate-binding protein